MLAVTDDDDLVEVMVIVAHDDFQRLFCSGKLHRLRSHTDVRHLQRGVAALHTHGEITVHVRHCTIGRRTLHHGSADDRFTRLVYHTTLDRVLLLGLYAHSKERSQRQRGG